MFVSSMRSLSSIVLSVDICVPVNVIVGVIHLVAGRRAAIVLDQFHSAPISFCYEAIDTQNIYAPAAPLSWNCANTCAAARFLWP